MTEHSDSHWRDPDELTPGDDELDAYVADREAREPSLSEGVRRAQIELRCKQQGITPEEAGTRPV
jgi:hypothetical protein